LRVTRERERSYAVGFKPMTDLIDVRIEALKEIMFISTERLDVTPVGLELRKIAAYELSRLLMEKSQALVDALEELAVEEEKKAK
jgi:hypothetical protein